MKKGCLLIKKTLSPELQELYDFLSSMKYTTEYLRKLEPLEVLFIRERCKELHLKGFDELIEKLELGVYYDADGERVSTKKNKKSEDEEKNTGNHSRKRVLIEFQGQVFQSKKQLANYLGRSICFITNELKREDSIFKIIRFDARRNEWQ